MFTSLAVLGVGVVGAGCRTLWNAHGGHEQLLFRPARPTYRFDPRLGFGSFAPNQEYWMQRYVLTGTKATETKTTETKTTETKTTETKVPESNATENKK